MKLNLGCGDHRAPEPWVNVDSWSGVRPDVLADVRALPWPDKSAEAIYCGHVLEHLPLDQVGLALAEVRRVLAPQGRLCIVGPDYDRATRDPDPVLLDVIRHGGSRWPGDKHHWLSTATATLGLVKEAFPTAVEVPVDELTGWPLVSSVWWQFAIVA